MSRLQKTRLRDWLVCLAILVVGLFFIAAHQVASVQGTTAKEDLVVVTGHAQEASLSNMRGVKYLWLTVGEYKVCYSSDLPEFERVHYAVANREPLTIGISTQRETLLPRRGWVPLYTLSINGKEILSYEYTISHGYRSSNAALMVGGLLLALGLWGVFMCYRGRNATPLTAAEREASLNDPRKPKVAAMVASVAISGAVFFAFLHPDSMETNRKVFGENPLGLPLRVFVVLFVSVLLAPFPIATWHGYKLFFNQMAAGTSLGSGSFVTMLFFRNTPDPELRRSQSIVRWTALYYLILMVGWCLWGAP